MVLPEVRPGARHPVGVYLVDLAVTVASLLLAAETGRGELTDEGNPG